MHFNKADHYFGFYELFILHIDKREDISDFRQSRSNRFGQLGWGGGLWGLGILTLFSFIHTGYSWIQLCLKQIVAKNLKRK